MSLRRFHRGRGLSYSQPISAMLITQNSVEENTIYPNYIKAGFGYNISTMGELYYKGSVGICPEFALKKIKAKKKICFIHCDYEHSGTKCTYNDRLYSRFDRIACCSHSVRDVFLQSNPALKHKTVTVRNFYDLKLNRTVMNDMALPKDEIHVFSLSRLSEEKGVARAIEALHDSGRHDIKYYVIGEGSQRKRLVQLIKKYNMENQVFLLGAIANPYPGLLNADYLLVPSLTEAAPMVFDEAKILGIQIIATETTSAKEMLELDDFVCENSKEGLTTTLRFLGKPPMRNRITENLDNHIQITQFEKLLADVPTSNEWQPHH